jgi:FkbM family methyltransferase
MRTELFYNPRLLCERLAEISIERRRLAKLRRTVAARLTAGHIDSLELLELLRLHPPTVIYDVGANVGTWTLLAKALYPQAQVHAFEPLPAHTGKFRLATQTVRGVHLHEIGLGSQKAETVMKVTDFSDASSLLPLSETGKKQWSLEQMEEVPIRIERLDDWVDRHQLPAPDLIKLDVQGYELEVLRGAEELLARTGAVLLEASFQNFYQGQCRFDELVSWLAGFGFHVSAFGHGTALGRPLIQSDVLFSRSN